MLFHKKTLLILSILYVSKIYSAEFVPGEILVKFKPKTTSASINAYIANEGHQKISQFKGASFTHVKFNKLIDVKATLEDYKNNPDVEYAQPNYIYHTTALPNDPMIAQLWAAKNTGQTIIKAVTGPDPVSTEANPPSSFSGKDMGLESAWGTQNDCSAVTVAVLDTGVNYNHEDLASNMWNGGTAYPNHGYDFVDNDTDPMDQAGHGTHVAGAIGAVGNNNRGVSGVCWKASLMAIRVLDSVGSGTTASIIQGIDFASLHGAKIINMSLGGAIPFDPAYSLAITNAQNKGVLAVVAAGNENSNNETSAKYPCNFTHSNLLCVAALSQDYSLASYSNYGTTSVDVGAPGTNILSTWPGATSIIVNDSLTSGWNFNSTTNDGLGFTYATNSINGNSTNILKSNILSSNYSNNIAYSVWKNFDLSATNFAKLSFTTNYDIGDDSFGVMIDKGPSNPFPYGSVIKEFYENSSSGNKSYNIDISNYLSSNTSIGFTLITNDTFNNNEVSISTFSIHTLTYNTNSYNVQRGTSMATPNVAGVAALIWSYNPNYTYQDVINAIKGGGVTTSSLVGKTTTGKSVDANNSLLFINQPSTPILSKVP